MPHSTTSSPARTSYGSPSKYLSSPTNNTSAYTSPLKSTTRITFTSSYYPPKNTTSPLFFGSSLSGSLSSGSRSSYSTPASSLTSTPSTTPSITPSVTPSSTPASSRSPSPTPSESPPSSPFPSSTIIIEEEKDAALFAGMVVFIDKDSIKSSKERQKIALQIKQRGGSVALMLSKKTTHLLLDVPLSLLQSLHSSSSSSQSISSSSSSSYSHSLIYQLNTAIKHRSQVVTLDFIEDSIQQSTLATQYVFNFTNEIKLIAAEIPLVCIQEPEAAILPTSIVAIPAILPSDSPPDPVADKATPLPLPVPDPEVMNASPMETMAYCPTVLASPISVKQFTPLVVTEKDVTGRIMSHIEPMADGDADEKLTFSFEEDRFYNYCQNAGKDTYLGLPERPESASGAIWGWGRGNKGQLGCMETANSLTPEHISEDLLPEEVVQVTCGDFHSAAVTTSGSVWTWGDGHFGCLGHGDEKIGTYPRIVECFIDIKISMVACGKSHTAVLTDHGTVWTWGHNKQMQLGYETESTNQFYPREVFSLKNAVFLSCGGHNSVVINKFGGVYTMGCNSYGQRGIGNKRNKNLFDPTEAAFPQGVKIIYVSVGQGFIGAVSTEAEVYTWGRNLENQCGNGSADDVLKPQKIEVGTNVIHVSCGDTHAACVTANGDVFTWGWGPVGQLGHAMELQICTAPTHVESVSDVCMVQCGAQHTLALSPDRGKVWMWGASEYGQSGIPIYSSFEEGDEDDDEDDVVVEDVITWLSPQVVDSLSKVSLLATGRDHNLVIVERDYIPFQFAKDGQDEELDLWLESNPKFQGLDEDAFKAALELIRDNELGSDFTLLHLAAHYNSEEVVSLLAGNGWISPDVTDENGNTPLHICAMRDHPASASILLERGARPDKKNKVGKTAIHVSVEYRSLDVLKEFVENSTSNKSVVDEAGNTPLHLAIKLRHFDMAKYLIEHAAQPQILDKLGKTAMDYCSFKEASYFKSLAQKNDVFISYAHVDLEFATKIKEYLELHSIKCWMDMTRLEAGNDWRLDIGTGLLSSKMVMFIGSRASVVSDWCIKELHMAKKHGLVIIPIWHQKVDFDSEVRSLIFGRGFVDFSNPKCFTARGSKLAKKLKYVLQLVKSSGPNPFLEIPYLTIEQLRKQLYLTIMLENYSYFLSGHTLEDTLHRAAIFTCTHSMEHTDNLEFSNTRAENLECAWGIVFMVSNLKLVKSDLEKWWQYAIANKKRVYLCMIRGSASDINTDDLPAQALTQTSVPLFYLESPASMHQLIYFVHLSQREEFMAKQVGTVQTKLDEVTTNVKTNETTLELMKRRFFVGATDF